MAIQLVVKASEDLSYKLDVNPKIIFDLIKKNVSHLHNTKAKYFNDLLHKIILFELGIKQISIYKFDVFNVQYLIDKIKAKYGFLKNKPELTLQIISILNIHHKISFFNKPLVLISNDSITVGQTYNG